MFWLKLAVSWSHPYSLQKEGHGSLHRRRLRRGLPLVLHRQAAPRSRARALPEAAPGCARARDRLPPLRAEPGHAARGHRPRRLHCEEIRGAQLGIAFAFDGITRQPNTLAAHALIEAARRKGVQGAVKEAMLKAFFVDSQDLTDEKTLARIAAEAGLDRKDAESAVADEDLRRAVAEEEDKARAMGVSGVPFFIFNQRLAVEGAQPPEVLLEAMLEAEKESAAA